MVELFRFRQENGWPALGRVELWTTSRWQVRCQCVFQWCNKTTTQWRWDQTLIWAVWWVLCFCLFLQASEVLRRLGFLFTQIAQIQMQDGVSMFIFLPDGVTANMTLLEESLTAEFVQDLAMTLLPAKVSLTLPVLRLSFSTDLLPLLGDLGKSECQNLSFLLNPISTGVRTGWGQETPASSGSFHGPGWGGGGGLDSRSKGLTQAGVWEA